MEIKINFNAEITLETISHIDFIREEFDCLFGHKTRYTTQDREMAAELINYLAKLIDSPMALEHLSQTLEDLETQYPTLF